MIDILASPIEFILTAIVLAVVPFGVWLVIFFRKHPVDRKFAILTTLGGMAAVAPIWLYQWLLRKHDHLDVFEAIRELDIEKKAIFFLTFVVVAIIEEQAKHWIVVWVDSKRKTWRGVADSIEFSVLAALGFAFVENIIYFIGILKFDGYEALLIPFIFRSLFSAFAHVFFSGVYGYHYGIAQHAKEWIIEESAPRLHHKFLVTRFFYAIFQNRAVNWLTRLGLLAGWAWLAIWIAVGWAWPVFLSSSAELVDKLAIAGFGAFFLVWSAHLLFLGWRHLRKIHLDDVLAEEEILEGLFLAILFHTIFNFVLWLEQTWLIPLYLLGGYLYLDHELRQRENLIDFESVEEKLRLAGKERELASTRLI